MKRRKRLGNGWKQLALWEEAIASSEESVEFSRPIHSEDPPKPTPEDLAVDHGMTREANAGRYASADPPPENPPEPLRRRHGLPPESSPVFPFDVEDADAGALEAASMAAGVESEALAEAARTLTLHDFRRFLREGAARRMKRLRQDAESDPFAWDHPSLAAVPAFVEDRSAVERLYNRLHGSTQDASFVDQ